MFIKNYRLTKRNDFQLVFKEGKRGFSKFFSVRYKENNLKNPRIAVVVSNKVSKKAVERNKLKRQIRSIVKLFIPDFNSNFDIIVSALSPALGKDYNTLQEELSKTFKKNKIT